MKAAGVVFCFEPDGVFAHARRAEIVVRTSDRDYERDAESGFEEMPTSRAARARSTVLSNSAMSDLLMTDNMSSAFTCVVTRFGPSIVTRKERNITMMHFLTMEMHLRCAKPNCS